MDGSTLTIVWYMSTIIIGVLFAFMSYKKRNKEVYYIDKKVMYISFIILWQLLAFAKCGTDNKSYKILFDNAKDLQFTLGYHQIELGFGLFNYLFRCITDNYYVYNATLAFIFFITHICNAV